MIGGRLIGHNDPDGDWHLDFIPPKDVVATRLHLAPGALFPTTPV